ncbi:MAG: TonB-dependent receptor plug domain-containing protein, partial [Pseudomonadota bacterium]
MGFRFSIMLLGTCATGALTIASAATAQTASPAPVVTADSADNAALTENNNDIIVTAQKRSETVQRVPLSMTVLTQGDLERRGVQSLYDVSRIAPSLAVVSSGPGENNLIIRGISSIAGSAATVGYYLDDTPIAASGNAA